MREQPKHRRVMQIRVLGPVEASSDGRPLALGGTKPRAVLAMLGLEANRTVTADHLIEGLWGEHPPASAAKMVQGYVWRLRTMLREDSGAQILTHGRGYELRIDPDAVDARRFERLLAAASEAHGPGEPVDAAREALALWRGPALADVADEPFAAAQIRRLEELRVEAAELAIAADLAAGRHKTVASEIDVLVAEHPLRERLHAQRMLALYRSGRQADALAAYRDARRTLVDEVGVEPGPELQRLHEAMLRQSPSLELRAPPAELPRELDTAGAPRLTGRDEELAWLRACWERAQGRGGALVTIVGERGIGKTRLAAELADRAHREGATVLYVAGTRAPEAAHAVIATARAASAPTLLVFDDADRAGADVRTAIRRLADEPTAVGSLVVAIGREASALASLRSSLSWALGPLDAAAVREIAGLYAPAGAGADVPVNALLEASGGVPRQVHERAAEWARREAARLVGADADRAAASRSAARALDSQLVGSVIDLQAARELAALVSRHGDDRDGPVVCPYKGLAPFDADDADYFCGREQLVADLVARLVGNPLLAVVGPSGSGKSSVVRAGLLPALDAGVLPGSERWRQELIRPGERPLRTLREAVSRLRGGRRAVLAVDQFEELFTACPDQRERTEFVAALMRAALEGGMVVVLAVRADFYGRCGAYPQLSALLSANTVLVGQMSTAELRRAIEQPAQRAGIRLEPELVERLLADCEGEPGALPLLSTALLELWRRRDGRELRLAGYERSGGVRGAVARLAEDAYARLDTDQRAVARRLLLRLAGEVVNDAPVRRRVAVAELDADRDEVAAVLGVLAESRLITISDGTVEVAHEALLREWPRLRRWLDHDTDGRRLHRRLTQAAREWDDGGRDPSELYRGARLASALEWRREHEPDLNAMEQTFLAASRTAADRVRRRLRLVLAGALALMVLAAGAAVIALDQRGQARAEARTVAAHLLGAEALAADELDRSLLLARQAVTLDDSPAARDNLLAALRRSPAAIGVMRGDGDALNAIALHPDGRTLAVGDDDGTVSFLDVTSGRRLGTPHQLTSPGGVVSLEFSLDGTRLATGSWDPSSGAYVDLFDAGTRAYITHVAFLPTAAEPSVHFSPDSRVLMAQDADADRRGSSVPHWDAGTGAGPALPQSRARLRRSSVVLGFIGSANRLVTSSEEERVTVIRDLTTLRPLRRLPGYGPQAALSAAAGLIAFGARDGSVRLVDVRTGDLRTARGRHEAPIVAMRFSPDGRRLVTAGRQERLIVWDPRRAIATETLEARDIGLIQDLDVAPDGRTAYSAGRDGTVIAWDLTGERRWERPFGVAEPARTPASLSVAARGSRIAVLDARGFVDLFASRSLRHIARIRPLRGRAVGAALAPDGATLALTTDRGRVEFRDALTRHHPGESQLAHALPATVVAYSADGRWVATGGDDAIVRVWDARRRTTAGSTVIGGVADLSFSHDGARLAITRSTRTFGGGLEIRSMPSLELVRTVPVPTGTVARFSPDGRSLIYGDRDGRLRILDTQTWKPVKPLIAAQAPVRGADVSSDGRLLATTSSDGTGHLWDLRSGRPIGAELSGGTGDPIAAAFLRDPHDLAVLHEGGGVVWDVRPASWQRHACTIAGRALTRSEWNDVLPQHPYSPAC